MDKIFSILDLAVSQISHSFFRDRFYNKSGGGFRENSARLRRYPRKVRSPSGFETMEQIPDDGDFLLQKQNRRF